MRNETVTAYLGLGSNLGNRFDLLCEALQKLKSIEGIEVTKSSPVYESVPEGVSHQPRFLNAAIEIVTDLDEKKLLKECQNIENEMGRVRKEHWGPRNIDIDILMYDDLVCSTRDLIIPHPFFHEREFVLRPLADISPDLMHPVLDMSISELLEGLGESGVKKMNALKLM
jgi:2-amino-4-hydroxy-6-hydroxymethyldihydropteridine diphosphokinase